LGFIQQIHRPEGDHLVSAPAEEPDDLRPGTNDTAEQQIRQPHGHLDELSPLGNTLCGHSGPAVLVDPRLIDPLPSLR
jgi:hypothetical protein